MRGSDCPAFPAEAGLFQDVISGFFPQLALFLPGASKWRPNLNSGAKEGMRGNAGAAGNGAVNYDARTRRRMPKHAQSLAEMPEC